MVWLGFNKNMLSPDLWFLFENQFCWCTKVTSFFAIFSFRLKYRRFKQKKSNGRDMKFYRQTCQALLWDITFWIQLAYLIIFIKTSWVHKIFFWVRQNTTKNEGGLEWNSLFGCIQYTPSFMISYKKKKQKS